MYSNARSGSHANVHRTNTHSNVRVGIHTMLAWCTIYCAHDRTMGLVPLMMLSLCRAWIRDHERR